MAYQGITTETGVADSLFQGALKVNSNFSEIYTALGDGTTINRAVGTGDGLSGGGNLTSNITISVDNTVVRTSGDQTIGGNKTFTDTVTINGVIPVGGIIMWSGTIATIPTGWALCDGTNGTPNLLDRFIVGAGSVNYNPGATGGADSVTLGTTNIPAHSHGVSNFSNPGDHYHGPSTEAGLDNTGNGQPLRALYQDGPPFAGQTWPLLAGGHTHTFNIDSAFGNGLGGTDAHENRPPYYALAFIMRTT